MPRRLLLAVGACLFLGALTGVHAQRSPRSTAPEAVCRVTGRVSGAGVALPGASIALRSPDGLTAATSTGPDGAYDLGTPPGTFDLTADLTGFDRLTRQVHLAPPSCLLSIDLTLTLTPRPSGTAGAAGRRAAAGPFGRGAGPGRGATPGARFQTLDVQPEDAAAAPPADSDADAPALLLPPGFAADATADAVAVTGTAARVDRGQINDRFDALARGDFTLGALDIAALAAGGGPGGQGAGGGPPGDGGGPGPGGLGGPGGGRGGRGAFLLGGRGGAQQRITTTADYTFGGSALNAAPYQLRADAPVTEVPFTRQSFGTTLGGPLKIKGIYDGSARTAFTLGYTGGRGRNLFDQYGTVPTAAMRAGDLSTVTASLVDPATGLPFPGNRIPDGAISPQARALLRFIPLPNLEGSTRNYRAQVTTASVNDAINLRLNHNFTPNVAGPAGRGGGGGGGGGRGGAGGGAAGRGGRGLAPLRRGTSVSMTAQLQFRRNDGDQANIFSTLGGTNTSTSLAVPVSLNVARGRDLHVVNVNVSTTGSRTTNRFAGVENVAAAAGITGAGADPFGWGVPSLSFTSLTGMRDVTPSRRDDRRLSAGYTWTHPVGRHVVRIGGDARVDRASSRTEANAAGAFVFTGLYTAGGATRVSGADFADFLLGLPQQASLQYGPGDVAFTGRSASLFAQDDWRLRGNVTLNLGIRYELQLPFTEANGRMANIDVAPGFSAAAPVQAGGTAPFTGAFPAGLVRTDWNNVAPRLGAAWRAPKAVVLRGGYGISYNAGTYAAIARNLAMQPPFAVTGTNIGTVNRLLLMADALAGSTAGDTTNTYGVDRDYVLGRVQTWNVDLSRNIRRVWNASAGYTRTTGANLDIVRAPNRGPEGLLIDGVQPFLWQAAEGSSVLNSATFRLQRRQARGLGGTLTYTLARSRDNAPSIGGGGGSAVVAQNEQDLDAEWGRSNFDRRHRLQANVQVDLPFGPNRRWLNGGGPWAAVFENWRVTTTFLSESGTPLTPRVQGAGRDVSQGLNGALRADYTGGPVTLAAPTIDRFFDTSVFSVPAAGLFGSSPRNVIVGPGTRQLDAQVSRDVALGGTRAVTIQVRASNLLNTANWAAVDTFVSSPTFGQVLSVRPMRSAQVNLRFRF